MNPLTNVKNIQKLNQRELELGNLGKKSWHDDYKNSAWIFIGGLPYTLTEGDIICVFSQYGEVVNINLVRDKATGKSKGYAFLCYEDQRSTVLAVDNLNSIKLLGRTIRVDHVADYKQPKEHGDEDEVTKALRVEGCAPHLPQALTNELQEETLPKPSDSNDKLKKKKKKDKKKKRKKVKVEPSGSDSSTSNSNDEGVRKKLKTATNWAPAVQVKTEKHDSGYNNAYYGHRKVTDEDGRKHDHSREKRDKRRSSPSREGSCSRSPDRGAKHNRDLTIDPGHQRDGKRDHYRSSDKDQHRDRESYNSRWEHSSKHSFRRDEQSQRGRSDYNRRDKR